MTFSFSGLDDERSQRRSFAGMILFDRDGTLVHDVPHNGNPALVAPVEGAVEAVRLARDAGLAVAVITNQPAIGDGRLSREQVDAVDARIDESVGPFDAWYVCPHAATEGCACRKPRPGLVLQAAEEFGVAPAQIVVIGDIGSDVEAARAAGARAVLVPTPETRAEEVMCADDVADDLLGAALRAIVLLSTDARSGSPLTDRSAMPAGWASTV